MQNTFRETGLISPNRVAHLSYQDTLHFNGVVGGSAPSATNHSIIIYDVVFAIEGAASVYTQLKENDENGNVILNIANGSCNFKSPVKVPADTSVHRHGASTGGWVTITYSITRA